MRRKKEAQNRENRKRRQILRCPNCGQRLMDSAPDTKTQLFTPVKGRKPDYYIKCGHCGAEIGVIKTE